MGGFLEGWPRWGWMWGIAILIYVVCKTATWRLADRRGVARWREWGYLLAWPGMDAAAFFGRGDETRVERPSLSEWLAGVGRIFLGVGLVWGVCRVVPEGWEVLRGWTGMVGLLQILHFGLFAVLSCWWRSMRVDAPPLMRQPIRSESLSEFWGRRWNRAFRDLTHQFLFRPLAKRLGGTVGMWCGFVVSGLIHEAVISIPAGGGYGGPTAFFTMQACGLACERSRIGKQWGLKQGWRGRIFAGAVLLGPAGWLAHRPFVLNVMVPFLNAIGAD